MDSSWPETLPDLKLAIENLIRGREFANQLKFKFREPLVDGDDANRDLVSKILATFTDSISILSSTAASAATTTDDDEDHVASPGRKSEDSSDSTSSKTTTTTTTTTTTSTLKDRRGCYKRRKASQTWTTITPNLVDDGHAWRKYGQKTILNAKHPRNYYRCTHKFDKKCQATKQVQRTESDPPMYRITYTGHHSCNNHLLLKSSHDQYYFMDSNINALLLPHHHELDSSTSSSSSSSILLSFGSNPTNNNNNNKPINAHHHHHHHHPSTLESFPCNSVMKREMTMTNNDIADDHDHQKMMMKGGVVAVAPDHHHNNCHQYSQTSSDDHYLKMMSVPNDAIPAAVGGGGCDVHGEDVISGGVFSCTTSTDHSLEYCWDMMMMTVDDDSVDFDDVLQFV